MIESENGHGQISNFLQLMDRKKPGYRLTDGINMPGGNRLNNLNIVPARTGSKDGVNVRRGKRVN